MPGFTRIPTQSRLAAEPCRRLNASAWRPAVRWGVLALLSLAFAALLATARLPAAPLLGSLVAAVGLAARGKAVRIPRTAFLCAQGIVGVMIAGHLSASIFHEMAAGWPIFFAGTFSTLSAAALLGWLLTRSRLLPGNTAIWGSSPGAATVMTLMDGPSIDLE
ncbi:AbrB family transcriptional regulator [Gluconacetobacter asukensis]|uniref:AbrB family transcriptional regulator n=1 Tax=Gluconacetobacter asukensis TaxID=1017181 RepID=UPI001FE8D0E6|nr:AbrB family transcriptional regulator [Gluconacetobacter asukensis]